MMQKNLETLNIDYNVQWLECVSNEVEMSQTSRKKAVQDLFEIYIISLSAVSVR